MKDSWEPFIENAGRAVFAGDSEALEGGAAATRRAAICQFVGSIDAVTIEIRLLNVTEWRRSANDGGDSM